MHPQSGTQACMDLGGAPHPPDFPHARTEPSCTSSSQDRHSQEKSLPVFCFTKVENPAKRLTKMYEHYSNQIYLHYVLLKQNVRYQIHHPIIQGNLISRLRLQAISWNCYSYKPLSSSFLLAEGKVPASCHRTGADEMGKFRKEVIQYSSQTCFLTKETYLAVSFT